MLADVSLVPLDGLTEPDARITYGVVKPGRADPGGVLFIRGGDIADGRILVDQLRTITHEVSAQYARTKLRGGELLVSLVGNPGQVALVPDTLIGANIARQVGMVRLRRDVEARFIKYFLLSTAGQNSLRAHSLGSVQQVINLKDLKTVSIPLPSPAVQRAIADLLGCLDDKIELNRQMNETLEAMARALFKSWFVDFDPVRAKIAGRAPFGMPADTAALFPTTMRGELPTGWRTSSVYEMATVVYGAPFASTRFNAEQRGRPLIRIRDLASESPSVWTDELHPKGHLVRAGDVVVGMDGEFRAHLWAAGDAWLNQRVCAFVPRSGFGSCFVRNALAKPLAEVEATETATTVIHLGKADIDRFEFVHGPDHVHAAFEAIAQPLDRRIVAGRQESRTLAELRDLLLPKLMSGELRIRDAEKAVEKVL